MIHPITAQLICLHQKVGEARLLRWFGRYSVGQSQQAIEELSVAEGDVKPESAQHLAQIFLDRHAVAVTILDAEYPTNLRLLNAEAPPILYVIGKIERLKGNSIAIIGTRRPSALGQSAAIAMATGCSLGGWTVVSGNAPGIDAAAHGAAVTTNGETIVYPPAPLDQYNASFKGGSEESVTVVSSFVPGAPIAPWMFLRRNTLVAAQCHGAFVAETGTRGGTLDTIKKLRKMNRSVFATALPPDAKHSNAHAMLVAAGVELLNVSHASDPWITPVFEAAQKCRQRPAPDVRVLADLFPEITGT